MNKFLYYLIKPASYTTTNKALCILRIGIGILTLMHGVPKMLGGSDTWRHLGTFVNPLGIYFLPLMWGFIGACTEFFGGIALIFGFATRLASIFLTAMMFVATVWHIDRGDSFNVYSFPLSLMVLYAAYVIMGSDMYSLDAYLAKKQV